MLRAGVDVLVHELNGFNLLGSNSHFWLVFQSLFLLAVQREAQKAAQRHLSLQRAMSGLLKHGQGHHLNLPPFPKNPIELNPRRMALEACVAALGLVAGSPRLPVLV